MTGKTGNRRKRTVVLAAGLLAVCILVSGCAARSGESAGGSARQKDFVKIAVMYFVHRVFFSLQEKAYAGG